MSSVLTIHLVSYPQSQQAEVGYHNASSSHHWLCDHLLRGNNNKSAATSRDLGTLHSGSAAGCCWSAPAEARTKRPRPEICGARHTPSTLFEACPCPCPCDLWSSGPAGQSSKGSVDVDVECCELRCPDMVIEQLKRTVVCIICPICNVPHWWGDWCRTAGTCTSLSSLLFAKMQQSAGVTTNQERTDTLTASRPSRAPRSNLPCPRP